MAVYVDNVFYWPGDVTPIARKLGRRWCHLWCDPGDEEALHAIAKKIGLRREWYQQNSGFNHYDLVPSKRSPAIRAGAQQMNLRTWMERKHEILKGEQ